jgi:hypothetical protein
MGMCTTVGSDVVTSAGGLGHATGAVIAGLGSLSSGSSICRAAHQCSGAALVWTLTLVVGAASVWVSASSRMTAPRKSAHAWAAIDRQSPVHCALPLAISVIHAPSPPAFQACSLPVVPSCVLVLLSPGLASVVLHIHPCSLPSIFYFLPHVSLIITFLILI